MIMDHLMFDLVATREITDTTEWIFFLILIAFIFKAPEKYLVSVFVSETAPPAGLL